MDSMAGGDALPPIESSMRSDVQSPEASARADRFVALLARERSLVLPSAWDAGSARLLERAGARAIAIQLDDIAWSLGHDSWASAPDDVVAACARICRAVGDVPVTIDLSTASGSAGLGAPRDATHLLRALIAAGIAGVTASGSAIVGGSAQSNALLASRDARAGIRLFIEARVDPPTVDPDARRHRTGRYDEMLGLARACMAAGADGVLLSGAYAAEAVRLVRDVSVPVSVDVGDGWAPPVQIFASAGVRSVRLGRGPLQAASALVQRVATEVLERGTYDLMSRHVAAIPRAS
jgi:2-methylisocitrate lyase-like PEP mutase family enzyme